MSKPRFTPVDVLALAVACFMLVALAVPTVMNARSLANPVKCQSNLKEIALAILFYSNNNRGSYPRTRADAEPTSWTAYSRPLVPDPFATDGPVENDLTAPLFLLVRTPLARGVHLSVGIETQRLGLRGRWPHGR